MLSRILVVALLSLAVPAFAQITISEADVNQVYDFGATHVSDTAASLTTMNIGSPSPDAQTFDFSGVTFVQSSVGMVIPAAGSTYADSFPQSDRILQQVTSSGTVPVYCHVSAEGMFMDGMVISYSGTTSVAHINPPEQVVKIPLTYSDAWSPVSDTMKFNVSFQGIPVTINMVRSSVYYCDAWGTLKAAAATYQCLRVKNTTDMEMSFTGLPFPLPPSHSRSFGYSYITNAGAIVALDVDSAHQNSSQAQPTSMTYSHPVGGNGVAITSSPDGADVISAYPAPASTHATLAYRVSGSAPVTVEIVDMLGRTVQTVVRGHGAGLQMTNVDLSSLPAGRYLYKLASGGRTLTQPFSVVR